MRRTPGSTPPNYKASPNVTYTYGTTAPAIGKLTKVESSVSTTEYTGFDILGRVTASKQTTDGVTYGNGTTDSPMTCAYNLAGALIEQQYPSGRKVQNVLDSNGDLSQVQSKKTANNGYVTYADSFSYDSGGAVKKMQLGNGLWETADYNERLQIKQIGLGETNSVQDILKLELGYGTSTQNNGSLREQKITVPNSTGGNGFTAIQTYAYDDLNRLQSATETIGGAETWKQTFIIDRYGNRRFDSSNTTTLGSCLQKTCNPVVSTSDNRFQEDQDGDTLVDYDYDANGAVIKDAFGQRFTYDAESHQKEFFAAGNGTSTPDATYQYDGDGRRVKKITNSETTIFVYNASGQLVAEYSTALATTPQVSYLTTDHLGSPRVITDKNGVVIDRKDYSAFGEESTSAQRSANTEYTGADQLRKNYTGYEKDAESGLEFAQARYYNPTHGRFTSVDPLTASASIRNPQTFNRYSYVLNSPYRFNDPLGLLPQGSGGGCSAEFSSCDDNGRGIGVDEYSQQQYQATIDLLEAQQAFARGDFDEGWRIIDGSEGRLQAIDENGDAVQSPNEATVTVEATVSLPTAAGAGSGSQNDSVGETPFQSLFLELWELHPANQGHSAIILDKNGNPDPTNQCAVKFAYMLLQSSLANEYLSKFKGVTRTPMKLAINAGQMAAWVREVFGNPITLTGNNIPEQLAGRTGIVHLENFQGVDDPSRRFNHIDLWNGHAGRMSSGFRYNPWFSTARRVTFWEVK